jgi:hypothetical protein
LAAIVNGRDLQGVTKRGLGDTADLRASDSLLAEFHFQSLAFDSNGASPMRSTPKTCFAVGAMPVRDEGPRWMVYPLDGHPELNDEGTDAKIIWQVRRLEVA